MAERDNDSGSGTVFVSGKGFHLLDTGQIPQIDGMDGTVQVRLLEAYAL